jgi:hypothetical protein
MAEIANETLGRSGGSGGGGGGGGGDDERLWRLQYKKGGGQNPGKPKSSEILMKTEIVSISHTVTTVTVTVTVSHRDRTSLLVTKNQKKSNNNRIINRRHQMTNLT